jgi:hypothetical protein
MSAAPPHPQADAPVGSARFTTPHIAHIAFAPEATCSTRGGPASTR